MVKIDCDYKLDFRYKSTHYELKGVLTNYDGDIDFDPCDLIKINGIDETESFDNDARYEEFCELKNLADDYIKNELSENEELEREQIIAEWQNRNADNGMSQFEFIDRSLL